MSIRHSVDLVSMKKCVGAKLQLLLLVLGFPALSQDLPIGEWRYHLSYQNARLVTGGDDVVFCATENGLFSFSEGSIRLITKNDGLSSVGPTAMAFDPSSHTLILGYANSVVDFVSPEGVVTMDDLEALDFGVPKGINEITVDAGVAYAATDFGIVAMNLANQQLTQIFTEIGPGGSQVAIRGLVTQNDTLYALADAGVLIGALEDNLLDFNNWSLVEAPLLSSIASFGAAIVTSRAEEFFLIDNQDLTFDLLLTAPFDIVDLEQNSGELLLLGGENLATWDGADLTAIPASNLTDGQQLLSTSNDLWIADAVSGLVRKSAGEQVIVPNGPISDGIRHIKYEEVVYAFYGTHPTSVEVDSSGFSFFDEGTWGNTTIEGFYNISDVGTLNNHVLLSSNGYGVYDATTNSTVDLGLAGNQQYVPALLTRNDGTWALLYGHDDALIFLERSGGLLRFDQATVGSNQSTQIEQSEAGTVWLTNPADLTGIYTYNPIEGLRRRITTVDDLPSNRINDVVIDLEDEAWIGTARGPAFFPDASFVFDEFGAIAPIFENGILLEDEEITALAIDGGNRKWIGTNEGVWVFNGTVDALDLRFTAEDSPLLSDEIREFAYDPETGEMFILTSRGLCSYQTGSSEGGPTHQDVTIYPNPVYPMDEGPVTLRGLASNAAIKVTDINGRLVTETEALGGTATWDLRDINGNIVVGGVYLVFSSTEDGKDTFVGKVAVIR